MKTINKILIVLVMLYFLGHEQYGTAIIYGLVVFGLLARNEEMRGRKQNRKYLN